MLGAITGDIVGSVYEWNNIKHKEFELFSPEAFFTDDTVLTVALAEAITAFLEAEDFEDAIRNAISWVATATPWPASPAALPRLFTACRVI